MQQLYEISNRLINLVNTNFKRSLYNQINWNDTLIEIRGARGVGKTTLLLQKAKEVADTGKSVLYVSPVCFFGWSLIEQSFTSDCSNSLIIRPLRS